MPKKISDDINIIIPEYKCEYCMDTGIIKERDPVGGIWISTCGECDHNTETEE